MTYIDLTDAIKIVVAARKEVYEADNFVFTPAWDFLTHVKQHLDKRATLALRGE